VSNAEVLYDEIREFGYRGRRNILKEFMHPFRAWPRRRRRCASNFVDDEEFYRLLKGSSSTTQRR
jgi:hypothetical protein